MSVAYTDHGANISPDGNYRYSLFREWDKGKGSVGFIGLNPSTADADLDDPTIRRCVGFARAWGYGSLYMLNLFAFRATLPSTMLKAIYPVGPDNDAVLRAASRRVDLVVAAWGNLGAHRGRDDEVRAMFKGRLHYLRLTTLGHPAHPLYLPASLTPQLWSSS